jgi:gas vesicle protein
MGVLGRIGSFLLGGALGAGVGAAIAVLTAPQNGDQFRQGVERRVDQVKVAGLEAQVRTEEELIRRFRLETNDPEALREAETQIRVETAQAIAGLGLHPAPPDAATGTRSGHTT